MKKETFLIKISISAIIILGLSALLITSCYEDITLEEPEQENQLKSLGMFPDFEEGVAYHYKDMVNNDSIEIIIPELWNGAFLVYAHGYVDPNLPIALPNDSIGNIPIKQLLTRPEYQLGFGYASTSYSENGFAVKEGVMDVMFLGKMLKAHFKPNKIFLGGVSEGGLVALKTLEKKQHIFDAGLVSCAPIGNFSKQLQYLGDFHVLFKHFFAPELAFASINIGSPGYVSPELMHAWTYGDLKLILGGIMNSNIDKLKNVLDIANVPYPPSITNEMLIGLTLEVLRFNIMATNDMIKRVHGVPYNNIGREYIGDPDVIRIKGDKQAAHRVKLLYETSGKPIVPVVLMHTQGDHVVPVWHINSYMQKVNLLGMNDYVDYIPIINYGHCNYTFDEVLLGITAMIQAAN